MTDPPTSSRDQSADDEPFGVDLANRLRQVVDRGPEVPGRVDDGIRAEIRGHFEPAGARAAVLRRLALWLAAAAALALVVTAWRFALPGRPTPHASATTVLAGDIDGNRVVDVRDALLLARRVDRGATVDPAWDLDGDGVVTSRDAGVLARAIVRLPEGAGS